MHFKTALFLFLASSVLLANCFNFEQPITKLVRKTIALKKNSVATKWAKLRGDIIWSAGRQVVKQPILKVLNRVREPMLTRNKENTEVKVKRIKSPHYFDLQKVSVEVDATFFLTIEWVEVWAYKILKGTPKKPLKVLVSYEKISGTTYIDHKCGQVQLTAVNPGSTDVYLYEEIDASHWDEEDAVKSHIGTIGNLKK